MKERAIRNALLGTLVIGVFTGCSTAPPRLSQGAAIAPGVDNLNAPEVVPQWEPPNETGNAPSYVVFGKRYYVMGSSSGYRQVGTASWYGPGFHGRKTSSGNIYNMYGISAAHKNLPIPTYARVTHMGNGRSIVVRIDDRGPFVGDRLIDLSYGAAAKLGILGEGTATVTVEALPPYQYLPGFEPDQMLAKNSSSNGVNDSQTTASFTHQAVNVSTLKVASASQPAAGAKPPVASPAREPVGPTERDSLSFSSQLASAGKETAPTASQPTVETGLKMALASPTRHVNSSQVSPVTTRPSTLETELSKEFAAPSQAAHTATQRVALSSASQPATVTSPPVVPAARQPAAGTALPLASAAASEPVGPAERDAFSFSNQLAGTTSGSSSAAASQPVRTARPALASPAQPALAGQPTTSIPAGQPLQTEPKVAAAVTPPVGISGQTVSTAAPPVTASPIPRQPVLIARAETDKDQAPAATPPAAAPSVTASPVPRQPVLIAKAETDKDQVPAATPSAAAPSVTQQPVLLIAKAETEAYQVPAATPPAATPPVTASPITRQPVLIAKAATDNDQAPAAASQRTIDTLYSDSAVRLTKDSEAPATSAKRRTVTRAAVTRVAATDKAPSTHAPTSTSDRKLAAASAKPSTRLAAADKTPAPARTVAQVARPQPAADSPNHLYLQVGAFTQRSNAEQLRNRLVKVLGYSVRIDPGRNNLHTVRVGPLNDPVEASHIKGRLAGLGINTPHVVFE